MEPTWPQFGVILTPRLSISCGRGCIFKLSAICVVRHPRWPQDGPGMASRCPRTAPKDPMTAARKAQGRPRAAQEEPRENLRWLQDGPKTFPSRFHVPSTSRFMIAYLENPPTGAQDLPGQPPRTHLRTPRRPPQETPRAPQESPREPKKRPKKGSAK